MQFVAISENNLRPSSPASVLALRPGLERSSGHRFAGKRLGKLIRDNLFEIRCILHRSPSTNFEIRSKSCALGSASGESPLSELVQPVVPCQIAKRLMGNVTISLWGTDGLIGRIFRIQRFAFHLKLGIIRLVTVLVRLHRLLLDFLICSYRMIIIDLGLTHV